MKYLDQLIPPATLMYLLLLPGCVLAQNIKWNDCTIEGAVCAFESPKAVRYGHNGTWVEGIYLDSVSCSNTVFGDPLPGTRKVCQTAEPRWSDCARENENCSFRGQKVVRYGERDTWVSGSHIDGVACNNRTFGDPLYGTRKKCQIATKPAEVVPPCPDGCSQTTEYLETVEGAPFSVNLRDYRKGVSFSPVSSSIPSWLSFDAEGSRFVGVYANKEIAPAAFKVDVVSNGQPVERINFQVNVKPQPNSVPEARQIQNRAFINDLISREANFLRAGVGYDAITGMTYDGHGIDRATLELAGGPRFWSTSSKESLHIALLTKALLGDSMAQTLIAANSGQDPMVVAKRVLQTKITAYEEFNRNYPAYGGYLPWVVSQNRGNGVRIYPADDWTYRVPALDNGQLAWSLYLAYNVLNEIGEAELASRYRNHFGLMVANGKRLFLNESGDSFVGEARFGTADNANSSLPPEQQTYFKDSYLLNDSLEGELFVLLMMLFSPDMSMAEKQTVWANKRLETLTYLNSAGQPITAFEGWVFSSHEEWKFLVLPYTDNQLIRDLFFNAQKIRTDYANRNGYPGFFAAVHDKDLNYLGKLGIPGLGTDQSIVSETIAPYAFFPILLSDQLLGQDTGLQWFRLLMSNDKMVGPYGITESIDSNDGAIAPLLTWDNKGTSNLALVGGIAGDIRHYLIKDNLYVPFMRYLERDLQKINPNITGTQLPMTGPGDAGCSGGQQQPMKIDFECYAPALANTTLVQNPSLSSVNSSKYVGQYRDPSDQWSSIIVDFPSVIDLQTHKKLSIKVLAPITGVLKVKLENGTSVPVEIDAQISQVNTWREYSFDFSAYADQDFRRLVVFFNAGVVPTREDIYYFDDLQFVR